MDLKELWKDGLSSEWGMSWIQASQVSDLHGHLHHLGGHFMRRSPQACSTWAVETRLPTELKFPGSGRYLPPQEILQHASARMRQGHVNSFICWGIHVITLLYLIRFPGMHWLSGEL